ncbi:MAG: hypothetical protein OK457_01570 [Thaumarchaeota archaeon]|nr:hypothetical protein [Nitrososphaerota archaeon]
MHLSGGNHRSVTGSLGSIKVTSAHKLVFAATFSGVAGTYRITGKQMPVSFHLQEIEISMTGYQRCFSYSLIYYAISGTIARRCIISYRSA